MSALFLPPSRQDAKGDDRLAPVVVKVVEVPEVCCLPWARIFLRNGMILSVNDEGVNVWPSEEAERKGVSCDGLTFGLPLVPVPVEGAESEAQIVSLRAELAGCADAGQAMELLRLVVDAMEAMEKPLAFLNALTNGAHGPVMGQLAFFLGTGMGNFRGVRDALRAARRRAALALNEEPPRRQDAKGDGR